MFISKSMLNNFIKENNLNAETEDDALKSVLRFFVQDGQDIEIAKDIVLDGELLDFVFEQFPNAKVTILSGYDEKQLYPSFDGLYNEEEANVLAENVRHIRQTYHRDIVFDEGFTVEQALMASRSINNIVKQISEARINGQTLSNYEKFLWAYHFVTDRVYTEESPKEDPAVSRNLVSVLSGDKIVCVGFASMLCSILSRLGIPCAYQSEISFDTKYKVYVNHATCAVRIEDDKYNKHGIYYSDPTSDGAVVKRLVYGMNSFNNALIPYREVPKLFTHPNVIDKVIPSLVRTDDINEVLANGINTPKILSKLFPEKTNGKSQDKLIKEYAVKEIENSNLYELINFKLDSLTIENVLADYEDKIKNILKIPMLVSMAGFGDFDQYIRSNISTLSANGLSKDEVLETLKRAYSKDAVEDYIISSHKKKYPSGTESTDSLLKRNIDNVISKLSKINRIVNTFNFESVKPLDADSAINRLAERLAIDSVRHLFGDTGYFTAEEVGVLLKQGFSFEDIIIAVKNRVKSLDMISIYIEKHPENLSHYATTNENEIFVSQAQPNRIYNTPYEKDFETLTDSATIFTNEEIFKAFINIYMSQGNDYDFAQKLACLTLRRTDLPKFDMT